MIAARDLAVVRGGRLVLDGVSLDVASGGALVVTGPNGAGKSTLLRTLAGLLEPTRGVVERRGRAAYLGPLDAAKPALTGRETLRFWVRFHGVVIPAGGAERRRAGTTVGTGQTDGFGPGVTVVPDRRSRAVRDDRVGEESAITAALDDAGLSAASDRPVRLLSSGQRRRLALARLALLGDPLWLLDEPATALDAAGIAWLERLVARHRAEGGAVVAATHQPLNLLGAGSLVLG